MRKLLMAAAIIVAVGALVFFLITRTAPEQTGAPGSRRGHPKAGLHDGVDSGASDSAGHEKSLTSTRQQKDLSPGDAGKLLASLRAAIAGGDWQRAKEICGKLAAIPAAFELLSEILLNNSSMEEAEIALRWRAAYILGLMGDTRAIPVFEQALVAEKARDVRSNIVLALGMFEDEQARPVLESLFLDETEDPAIRQSAAQYLARVPGGTALLVNALDSEDTGQARAWAVKGLTFSAEKQLAAGKLASLLLDREEDTGVRCSSAEALGTLGHKDALGALVTLLQSDPDLRVRNSCARALGSFKNSGDACSALRDTLHNDKNPAVRGSAARALGDLGGEDALADMKDALGRERDRVVKVGIIEVLGKIGGEESGRILKAVARNDTSVHVRRAAEKALKEINAKEPEK